MMQYFYQVNYTAEVRFPETGHSATIQANFKVQARAGLIYQPRARVGVYFVVSSRFNPSHVWTILTTQNKRAMTSGKTKFVDFFSAQGHPQQKVGQTQEFSDLVLLFGTAYNLQFKLKDAAKVLTNNYLRVDLQTESLNNRNSI